MQITDEHKAKLKVHKKARDSDLKTAIDEIKEGKKKSHYIWYIMPQLSGFSDKP